MQDFYGYRPTSFLSEGEQSIIYRGVRINDNKAVIIKRSKLTSISSKTIIDFKKEHEYGSCVQSLHTVKYIDYIQDPTLGVAVVIEDDGYTDLSRAIPSNGFDEEDFLYLALQIAKGLQDIHAQGLIHKDIKPNNIIIHPLTRDIKIIDFGSATQITSETQSAISLHLGTGTLAYISPEQTGRINRSIDYRTDFYSLGITLYQLICGKLPFEGPDPISFIHQHIAKIPTPPHVLKPTISEAVSNIIILLMKKEVEHRYQSCQGIIHDLSYCLSNLSEFGSIPLFELRQQDFSDKFVIPHKFYGREIEAQTLIHAFDCISQGRREVVVVSGDPGIGKSTLIYEIQKPLTLKKGHFISGKFEQYNNNSAYSAIIQAFKSLITQLLTESEQNIRLWREQLLSAIGHHGQMIINLIPELSLIIGEQPVIVATDPIQAKNLFNTTFLNFVRVFSQADHPLVLFVDDLQWADSASMELLTLLATDKRMTHFLLIGAYRDNDPNLLRPIYTKLEEIKSLQTVITSIHLKPLTIEDVNHWVAEILHVVPERTLLLTGAIYFKTAGNPFFVKYFLQSLHQENIITLSSDHSWQWDMNRIQLHPATDNVITLMTHQISQLPVNTQEVLAIASCLGNEFSLRYLCWITIYTEEQILNALQIALQKEIIYKSDEVFKFAHDRIQEAIYQSIAAQTQQDYHLHIGKKLLKHLNINKHIFEIVDQLNKSNIGAATPKEQFELADLNLIAASQAKHSTAYAAALSYLYASINCVNNRDLWKENYNFAFKLYRELTEVQYLNGNLEQTKKLIEVILPCLTTALDRVEIYNIYIIQLAMQGKYEESLNIGNTTLQLLGSCLPITNCQEFVNEMFAKIRSKLIDREIGSLINLPLIEKEEYKAILKTLFNLYISAYLAGSPLLAAIILMMVQLSLDYGHAPESCMAYAAYGMLLCTVTTDYQLGDAFGKLAIKLAEKFNNAVQKCRSYNLIVNCIYAWSNPLHSIKPLLELGIEAGKSVGELQYVGYLKQNMARSSFDQGMPLSELQPILATLMQFAVETKNQIVIDLIRSVQLISTNLLGYTQFDTQFMVDNQLDDAYIINCNTNKSDSALALYYLMKAEVLYIYGFYKEALALLRMSKEKISYIPGQYALSNLNWYTSLTLLAMHNIDENDESKKCHLAEINQNQQQMKIWTKFCPHNFMHKYLLVEAELNRLQQNDTQAMDFYEQAISLAGSHGFIHEQALASELAAKFWLAKHNKHCAQGYINEAYLRYKQWGALRKLNHLKIQYRELLTFYAAPNLSDLELNSTTTISTDTLKLLDLASILKATQSISRNVELKDLLHNIMRIIIENAGAQQGAFFLVDNDELFVQAESAKNGEISTLQKVPLSAWTNGSISIINLVKRTHQTYLINNASEELHLKDDPYIVSSHAKSILCIPVLKQHTLIGMLYVENNILSHAFSPEQTQTLMILTGQMAVSLENAIYVQERLAAAEQIAAIERMRAEEAVKHKQQQTQLMDTICHEINNPLAGIVGNLEFLQEDMHTTQKDIQDQTNGLPPQLREKLSSQLSASLRYIQAINICVRHLRNMAKDILMISKVEANKITLIYAPLSLTAIVRDVIIMYTANVDQKGLKIIAKLPAIDCWVKSDANRLKEILINLVVNAINFTERDGTITISLAIEKQETNFCIVKLAVKDTGIGMSPEEKDHIFQRFSQANHRISSQYGGTGLGLAICKDFVQLMHGEIEVESEKGIGTTFTVKLTCEVADPSQALLDRSSQKRTIHQVQHEIPFVPKNILVAEDNEVNQKMLQKILTDAGHTVQLASNGDEAIAKYKNEKFDIIFMDIGMPAKDGIEATREIRSYEQLNKKQKTPIIILSGFIDDDHKARAREAGVSDYCYKPYNKQHILDKISMHTDFSAEKKLLKVSRSSGESIAHIPATMFQTSLVTASTQNSDDLVAKQPTISFTKN